MAQGRGDITQRIALEGGDQVRAELADMGAAGERAAQQLGEASQGAAGGLNNLSGIIANTGAKIGEAGELMAPFLERLGRIAELGGEAGGFGQVIGALTSGVSGFVAAAGAVIAGFAGIATSAANATIATENQARTLGLSVEKFEGLKFAATQVGVSAEGATRLMDRFALAIGKAREETAKEQAAATAAIPSLDQSARTHEALSRAVDEAALAYARAKLAAGQMGLGIRSADLSVEHAQLNLRNLKDELGSTLGLSAADRLRLKDAELALAEAEQKSADARQKQKDAIEAQRLAEEKLREEQRKRANELRDALTKQNSDIKDATASVQDFNKSIVDAVAAFGAGGGTGIDGTLGVFADRFNAIADKAKQAALAQSVFGKGWAEIVPMLRLGSEGIRKLAEEMEHLGVTPTDKEKKWATELFAALMKLETVAEGLKNAFGNILGQLFTPMFAAITEGLAATAGGIRTFAQVLVDTLQPPFQVIGGIIREIFVALSDVGTQINQAFGSDKAFSNVLLAIGVFRLFSARLIVIVGALMAVHEALAYAFGSDNASRIEAFILIGYGLMRMLGGVTAGVRVLTFAFGGLSVAMLPLTLLVGLIVAVGAALYLLYGDTQALSDIIRKVFGEDAAQAFDSFVTRFRAAKDEFIATWNGAVQGLKDIWNNGLQLLADLFEQYVIGPVVHGFDTLIYWAGYLIGLIQQGWAGVGDIFTTNVVNPIKAGFDTLIYWASWLIGLFQKGLDLAGRLAGMAGGGAGGAGAEAGIVSGATGGLLRGPGTGTSDSIPLLGSNGEYIVRAAAVAHWGANFLHRINRLEMPSFAMGGMIGGIAPPRALGGLAQAAAGVEGRVQVDLTHGGHTFSGLLAPTAVAKALVGYASSQTVRSLGRRPSTRS